MFGRLFGKPKADAKPASAQSTIETLSRQQEVLEMLEKREKVLQKKASAELESAKEYTRLKNKRAAMLALKKKKMYEAQADKLAQDQLRLQEQMIMVEGFKATTEIVGALRSGAHAMKRMQKETNIDDVDKTMEEIQEQTDNMRQIQDALSQPMGYAADLDEDELEAELAELEAEELDEELLAPSTALPSVPVHAAKDKVKVPAAAAPQPVAVPAGGGGGGSGGGTARKSREEEELEALQAEMAL